MPLSTVFLLFAEKMVPHPIPRARFAELHKFPGKSGFLEVFRQIPICQKGATRDRLEAVPGMHSVIRGSVPFPG